jgi:hypothetical protein
VAYTIYLLLSYAPFVGALLLLLLGYCVTRLVCLRGNQRSFSLKESLCTCYGLWDPNDFTLPRMVGWFRRAAKDAGGIGAASGVGGAARGTGKLPRPGDDSDAQEERVGFLL